MQGRFVILLLLLSSATILLDLCVVRAVSDRVGTTDIRYLLGSLSVALALQQLNLATLCIGLCSLPLVLRWGLIAAIVAIVAWIFDQPWLRDIDNLNSAVLVAAEALIATWILRTSGYRLIVPGDDPELLRPADSPLKFTLANLFGFVTVAALAALVMRSGLRSTAMVSVVLPGFLLSIVLTMWAVMTDLSGPRRYVIAMTAQVFILAVFFVFGPLPVSAVAAIYLPLVFVFALVLRQMDVRLTRFALPPRS